MVNAQSTPSSSRLAITASPSKPPRDELPCAVPNPSHSMTLPVKRCGVHHHHSMMPMPPHNREDDTVPERPDNALARSVDFFRMLPAKHFVAQRRSECSNDAVDRNGNKRNLEAPCPRQGWQACVIMRIDRPVLQRRYGIQDCVGLWHVVSSGDAFILSRCAGSPRRRIV